MPQSPPAVKPTARPDVALRRVGSEWVLYDAARDRAHVLNATATAVWAYCDGSHDPDAMTEALARDVPGTEPAAILRDIEDVLRRFAAEGLLR